MIKLSHPGAICRRLEDDAVFFIARRLDGAERGTDIAVCAARAACHLPAGQCAACDNAPLILAGHRHTHADVVHTAHDDAEEQAFVFVKICRFRVGLILGCGHGDVGAGGNGFLGGRISTGGPTVIFVVEQDGLHIFVFQHKINALVVAIAVAVFVLLLENEVFDVALVQVVETDRDIVGIAEDKLAFFVRGVEADGFVAGLGILICTVAFRLPPGRIERKRDIGKKLAVLVDFDAAGFGDVGQVELHGQVGVGAAALEIEELQRVIRVVGQGIAAPKRRIRINLLHQLFERGVRLSLHLYDAGGEVDGGGDLIMDAAEIGDENAVDEHPDIVVAGELEGHRLGAALGGHAVIPLDKTRGHGHPKVVADPFTVGIETALKQRTVLLTLIDVGAARHGDCVARRVVEGEKLALWLGKIGVFVQCADTPGVIEAEGMRGVVVDGIVGRLIFAVARADLAVVSIIIVIALIVDLEQPADVPECLLADRAALGTAGVRCFFGLIEEVGQRLLGGRIAVLVIDLARLKDGVAAGEPVLYDSGADAAALAGPLVDRGAAGALAEEFQVVILVDAEILDVIKFGVGVVAGLLVDPIVEQIELNTGGRHSVRYDMLFQGVEVDHLRLRRNHGDERSEDGEGTEQTEYAGSVVVCGDGMFHNITSRIFRKAVRKIRLYFN